MIKNGDEVMQKFYLSDLFLLHGVRNILKFTDLIFNIFLGFLIFEFISVLKLFCQIITLI
jgi:hypothetical protein